MSYTQKPYTRKNAGAALLHAPAFEFNWRFDQASNGLMAALSASFWAWASARSLPRVV